MNHEETSKDIADEIRKEFVRIDLDQLADRIEAAGKREQADLADAHDAIARLEAELAEARRERDSCAAAAAQKPVVDEDTSDGYHTFRELYRYRMLYNAAFFNALAAHTDIPVVKSHRHSDGEPCFGGGWFIVMAQLPTGQVSNHYEDKDWPLFHIPVVEFPPKWDGHTPNDAADRIEAYLREMSLRGDNPGSDRVAWEPGARPEGEPVARALVGPFAESRAETEAANE